MAAINFPDTPTNGQIFESGGMSWTYVAGIGWTLNSAIVEAGSGFTFIADTMPLPVNVGDTWFDSSTGASGGTSWVAIEEGPAGASEKVWVQFAPGVGGAQPPVVPWATTTIPSLAWYIAGGAGSSIGAPRAITMANFTVSSPEVGLTLTDGGSSLTVDRSAVYQASFQIQTKGHWVCWVQIRHIRSSTTINGATASDARGTWGNPPGVNGFDAGYQKALSASAIFPAIAGDKLQPVIWTSGGADTSALCGDNDGYSRINITRIG